ncbi:MAG: ABC transporter permease subunit [Mesorhizobium sp.]|uniref:ABC transporter permease n=1 Tax=Mesorhizobium sp. TaxID=1871066 RepID=UPI000FE36A6C|nr:ABC transporter permease subunit [Mesorhizobium sp.]RWG80883.1 MAG: ABC transporter permease subunit [Mesorhizobium sp.]RWI44249.1 MAG: ABC transporter permease subunit [Mesorhizobium sp.]RWJ25248.1 MAG: ABC transporter permease subunit [Mesorhizobium sp.]RWJ89662.1 MAG: ABC transporter permease subunit [Mesorhizobium sp.]RWK15042.1 MAG: ABC transporter permease subunit [Mesorhizobium sp.]
MDHPSLLDVISFGPDGWAPAMLAAAAMTILIASLGFVIGGVIGVGGAWAKLSGGRVTRALADAYTTVLRGVPELLVIYLIYFGGSAGVSSVARWFGVHGFVGLPPLLAGSIAVGATMGAQFTEVFRGAFQVIQKGELDAAIACGMSISVCFRRIIAPLTLRYALPGLGSIWQVCLKESSLVSITGAVELMRQAQIGASATRLPFDFFLVACAIFLIISTASGVIFAGAEAYFLLGSGRK